MNENETDPRPADASSESSSPERGQSEQPTAAQPTLAQPAAPAAPQWTPPVSAAPQSPWQQPQGYQQQQHHQQHQHQHQHQQQYAQYPGYQQQHPYGGWTPPGETAQQPAWAVPVGTDQQPPRSGRGRRIFVAGAAAVLIALGAGGVGAATALALDDGGSSPSVKTGNSSVTRVVDRSSLSEIAAAVQDSVVSIKTGSGEGSGVVLTADGYIVTNNHVVSTAQGSSVTVIFADGDKASATIVGTDPRTDLAVVKATDVKDLKPATFGKSANMQVGDTVLAIGSPLGLEGSVTAGIISAKDRTIESGGDQDQQSPFGGNQQQGSTTTMSGLLQTDAPINPGNSGGALVNTNGEVIGINSAIATQGQGSGNIGLGFAIPSDKAGAVAKDLMAGRKVSHPALGVSVTTAENGGALVSSVTPNSAAAKAGLEQGDVVTKVDGKEIGESDDLVAAIQAGTVGQKMTIDYTRDGVAKQAQVTLTEAQ